MANASFTIEQKISESTTTTVYRAYQEALDRRVLLKVLHKHLAADEDFAARFRREARACAAIHSENIVQVYDLTEFDGAPAIVMEFVEGKSLKEILEKEGKQSAAFVRMVALEVLKGLAVAHEKGIVHRDVKPGNILLGESGAIKVTDFGLASVPRSPTLTLDGMVLGTPAYMSPEQARGEVVDERTDLFSLGVTLVELLTAQRIFEGQSYSECLKRILSFSPVDAEQHLVSLPPDFASFMRRLLAPKKEERFTSAIEALRSLDAAAAERSTPRSKRTLRAIGTTVLVLFLLVALAIAIFSTKRGISPGVRLTDTTVAGVKAVVPADTAMQKHASTPSRHSTPAEDRRSAEVPAPSAIADNEIGRNDSASVVIKCQPWAMVYLDNVYLGQTPLPHAIAAKAGSVTVTFTNPLFVPITRNVLVPRNGRMTIEENFLDHAGYLMIRVVPWAEVYVDDQYRDTTPLGKPLVASAGARKIRLHNPSYEDLVYDATVEKGDTLNLSFNLMERKRQ